MQRDANLIRAILLAIEADPHGESPEAVQGYSEEQVGYHNWLIWKQGLAEGVDASYMGTRLPQALLLSLTPSGHDFAEAARNDAIWNRVMSLVAAHARSVSIEVLKQLLARELRAALGLT